MLCPTYFETDLERCYFFSLLFCHIICKSLLAGLNGTRFNHVCFFCLSFFAYRLVTAVVVFGFMFYITDLPGNFYLNMAAMYIGDVPGVLIMWITVQK